jgi:hypothetical protein
LNVDNFVDIATTSEGSFYILEPPSAGSNEEMSVFLYGFGRNIDKVIQPNETDIPISLPSPLVGLDENNSTSALNSIFCGYKTCFAVQKKNSTVFYSW